MRFPPVLRERMCLSTVFLTIIAVQTRNLLATRLGLRTGSFEDAFLKDAASSREL